MFYYGLKSIRPAASRRRAIRGLQRLRGQLTREIPRKDAENHLLLATWNIRDLTKNSSRRLPESLFYIAEVISRFDFVAVQEVNGLEEWHLIMDILGPDWDFIASDEADRSAGGNGERLTYVFDKRKVWFQNIAGEIVLPPEMLISQTTTKVRRKRVIAGRQFSRTPYVALFQSGWFKFAICTVHIYYGEESGPKLERRRQEIKAVAKYFGDKAGRELRKNRALILLGDFNIVSPDHRTMEALEGEKFVVPSTLREEPTNMSRTKHYDQIAFRTDKRIVDFVDQQCEDISQCNSGVFFPYDSVFREQDEEAYSADRGNDRRRFATWRTYQISDHLPMWVRLDINDADEYIADLI